jgi:hypothetical protein
MNSITVVLAAEPTRVRMLVRQGRRDVLKAVLGPAGQAHPRAATTLLEGLALWHQQQLGVVLCAEEPSTGCTLGLCNALGFGVQNVHYEVGVAHLGARHRTLAGIGDFSDLRQLDLMEALR